MRKKLSPQEIINQYIETGTTLTETVFSGDYKKGNVIAKKNRKLFDVLAKDKELAEQVLSQVMICNTDKARSIAAADSLRLNILTDKAVEVLKDVAKRGDIIGFESEMVLKIWRGEVPGKAL
jgi:hypothetical protein